MNETLLKVLFLVLLLPGIAGTLLPFIPGLLYMLLVTVLFSLFALHFSFWFLGFFGLIAVAGLIVEHTSGAVSTHYFGGSKQSLFVGTIALFLGSIFFPPFGGLLAMFIAIFASEMADQKGRKRSFETAAGSVAGSLASRVVLFVLSLFFFTAAFLAVLF